MTTTSIIPTTVTIEKVSTVTGRDGPQWELQVKWPWSTKIPDKIWLDKKTWDEPMLGAWPAKVEKRGLKRKADGNDYDGSQGWMYNYRLVAFGTAIRPQDRTDEDMAASTVEDDALDKRVQVQGTAVPADYQERQARAYDLGMAFNKAVDLVAAFGIDRKALGIPGTVESDTIVNHVRYWRDRLLRDVILVAPAPEHYCYTHNVTLRNNPKTEKWGHILEDGKGCVE